MADELFPSPSGINSLKKLSYVILKQVTFYTHFLFGLRLLEDSVDENDITQKMCSKLHITTFIDGDDKLKVYAHKLFWV